MRKWLSSCFACCCLILCAWAPRNVSNDRPMLSRRPPRSVTPSPKPTLVTVTNRIPPSPSGGAAVEVVTNILVPVRTSVLVQDPAPLPGVRTLTFNTSTPIAGMTGSNNLQSATNADNPVWRNRLWVPWSGGAVTINVPVNPAVREEIFRLGTNWPADAK